MENKRFAAVSCDGAAMTIRFNNTNCACHQHNTGVKESVLDTQGVKGAADNPHKLAERHRAISAKWYSGENK